MSGGSKSVSAINCIAFKIMKSIEIMFAKYCLQYRLPVKMGYIKVKIIS